MKRSHPFEMIVYIKSGVYFLLLPLLWGIIARSEVLICVSLISVAVFSTLKWLCRLYRFDPHEIVITNGVFFRRRTVIPISAVSELELSSGIFCRIAGAVKLTVYPIDDRRSSVSVYVNRKDALSIKALISPSKLRSTRFSLVSILTTALLTSKTAAGLLLASTVSNRIGRIFQIDLQGEIYSALSDAAQKYLPLLPRAAATLAAILFVGFLTAMTSFAVKFARLACGVSKSAVEISHGMFAKTRRTVPVKGIAACASVQSAAMLFAKRQRIQIFAKNAYAARSELFVTAAQPVREIAPRQSDRLFRRTNATFIGFAGAPIAVFCAQTAALAFLDRYIAPLSGLTALLAALCLFRLIVHLRTASAHFVRGGMGCTPLGVRVCGRKSGLYDVFLPKNCTAAIKITRSPIDRVFGRCNVCVYAAALPYAKFKAAKLDYGIISEDIFRVFCK